MVMAGSGWRARTWYSGAAGDLLESWHGELKGQEMTRVEILSERDYANFNGPIIWSGHRLSTARCCVRTLCRDALGPCFYPLCLFVLNIVVGFYSGRIKHCFDLVECTHCFVKLNLINIKDSKGWYNIRKIL